jgi:hypothetical protein
MKKMMLLMLTFFFLSAASMNAQVTIGSEENPHPGAIMDLRSDSLGLLFPKVSLSDVSTFQSEGDPDDAIGMTIYNTNSNTDNGYGMGLYCWDGSNWSMVGKKTDPGCSGFYVQFGTWTGPETTWIPAGGTSDWRKTNAIFTQTLEGLCVSRQDFRGKHDEIIQHCDAMTDDGATWRLPNIAELNYILHVERLGLRGTWAYHSATLQPNNHVICAGFSAGNWPDAVQTNVRDSRCVRSM